MFRLTEKETNIIGVETGFYRIKKDYSSSFIPDKCGNQRELNSLFLGQQKLGQLEDYEDKLKIDLLRGLEAMDKGCYAYYADDKEPAFIEPDDIKIMRGGIAVGFYPEEWNHNKRMSGQMCHFGCPFENYGKTWALTREELL